MGSQKPPPPPCVPCRPVVAPLRGPGQSPALPFACCVGSLRSVGRCGRCSCRCRFRVHGAPSLVTPWQRNVRALPRRRQLRRWDEGVRRKCRQKRKGLGPTWTQASPAAAGLWGAARAHIRAQRTVTVAHGRECVGLGGFRVQRRCEWHAQSAGDEAVLTICGVHMSGPDLSTVGHLWRRLTVHWTMCAAPEP